MASKFDIISWVRSIDDFGPGVGLNYRGAGIQKSMPGAFCTIFYRVFLLYAIVLRINTWINRHTPHFTATPVHLDFKEMEPFSFEEHYFNFGVGLFDTETEEYVDIDPRLGEIHAGQ